MHALPELVLDLFQLRPHPFRDRDPLHPEPSAPGHRADVREAQEIERLRLAGPASFPVPGSVPPELDQPRLTGVQFQPELREPAAQLVQEPVSVIFVLEPDDEVVRLCGLPDYADDAPGTWLCRGDCAGVVAIILGLSR
jgi:hypothetical protein